MNWRAFSWSLRREAQEYRGTFLAPVLIAVLALAGFLYFILKHATQVQGFKAYEIAKQSGFAAVPYSMATSIILVTAWIVGVLYASDALYGERRERSILFWKSMPVSDLVTVAAKACVPLVALPLIACAAAIVTQLLMLALSSIVFAASGGDPSFPWQVWPIASQTLVMFYGVFIHALWFAPIYAWLLLVSALAPRAVLLWAFAPVFGLFAIEKLALGSSWLMSAVQYRIVGAMTEGFARGALKHPVTELSQLDPSRFFTNANLWLGLAVAALCFALTVRIRRYAGPT